MTLRGCACRNDLDTTRLVVANWPFGHSDFSSTSTWPLPSTTRREAHGSGTQAPSIFPASKRVSEVALSVGVIFTSPPPCWSVA